MYTTNTRGNSIKYKYRNDTKRVITWFDENRYTQWSKEKTTKNEKQTTIYILKKTDGWPTQTDLNSEQ